MRAILIISIILIDNFPAFRIKSNFIRLFKLRSSFEGGQVTVGNFNVFSDDMVLEESNIGVRNDSNRDIKLFDISSGWGNGQHPTTRLCMNFISENVKKEDIFLDYGTGSGILSILATKCGAKKCIAVDVDYDSIKAAQMNFEYNGVSDIIDLAHTREVYFGNDRFPRSDVTVANILPGALTRLTASLWFLTKPNGLLCLSGVRPKEFSAVRRIYEPYVQLETEKLQTDSHPIYGEWICWSVRTKDLNEEELQAIKVKLTAESMMDT